MDKVPNSTARGSDSDDGIPSIGDTQKSAKWEDRLAEARIRRARVLAQRDRDESDVAGTAGVKKSAILHFRLARAQDRNVKSLADRAKVATATDDPRMQSAQDSYKKTVLVALAGVQAKLAATAPRDGATVAPAAETGARNTAPSGHRKRRSGAVYFAAAVVIGLLIAVALPGQFRDFTIRLVTQTAEILAGSPDDAASPINNVTVAANLAPPVAPSAEVESVGGDVPGVAAPAVSLVSGQLELVAETVAEYAIPALAPAPSGIANGAAVQATTGFSGIREKSLRVVSIAAPLSDPLPTQPHAPPVDMVVSQPNVTKIAAAAGAPSAMVATPATPVLSDTSSSDAPIQVPALLASSVVQVSQAFLAGTLSDPLPALLDAPPAALATGVIAPAVAVKQPRLATDAATLVAAAPAATSVVTALPRISETSASGSALPRSANTGLAANALLLAAILADPLGADAPLRVPGPATPIRVAANYSATTTFAAVIQTASLNARLPTPFGDVAPSVIFVSLPQSAAPGDAPAALVSPEPLVLAPESAPIARPQDGIDAARDAATQAAVAGFDVLLYAPLSWSDATLGELTAALRATGYLIRTPVRVRFRISRDNVRYFHASDAQAARVLAAAIGARVRDFTEYAPSPPVGTVEVWLAGNASPRIAARPSAPATPSTGSQEPALLLLRDKLVESLRRGDHL